MDVSVPLRGLGSWKGLSVVQPGTVIVVSVPLRGLGSWKVHGSLTEYSFLLCFSPLSGIRFVESFNHPHPSACCSKVSVPLRGLGSWKEPIQQLQSSKPLKVSVPLRGLGSWKDRRLKLIQREDSTEAFRKSLFYPHFSHAY